MAAFHWVTEDYIRRVFNELDFVGRAERRELLRRADGYNNHLTKRQRQRYSPPEPPCTHSQMVTYYEFDGKAVAIAHQLRRRDGSLGASGSPDPKRLVLADRTIAYSPNREPDHFE